MTAETVGEVLSREGLRPSGEINVFRALVRWAGACEDVESRRASFEELLRSSLTKMTHVCLLLLLYTPSQLTIPVANCQDYPYSCYSFSSPTMPLISCIPSRQFMLSYRNVNSVPALMSSSAYTSNRFSLW